MTTEPPAPRDDRNRIAADLPDQPGRHAAAMAAVTKALGGRIGYGGDYNPEQWPESVWPNDVALMREAGVTLVSLGIFSWAWLQPKAGVFEFAWLDRILDLLHAGGIAVDLANASATPPPWFSHQHPETLPVDADGVRRSYGARQAFCPSSPRYRAASAEITEAIAERYADHPAVVMWHVHNEYACHNAACYCDTSAAAFRGWLQRRYGDLAELNAAWGTAFWSQRYYDWDEVQPPRRVTDNTFANPTQQLDFARFCSDELLDCYRAEAAILRRRSTKPVTTNFMGFFPRLDYFTWAGEMDIVSNDHYRIAALGPEGATHDLAMTADLTRSLADGAPWLLMEHSTSAVNWQPRNPAKPAGQMRRDSMTHVARGADAALFFQWRASAAGAEKFHSALVPHVGPDSDRFREVAALGRDLAAIGEVAGSRVVSDVAIVFDWNAWWGSMLDSHPTVDLTMLDQVRAWHRALWQAGVTCDFVHPDRDLGRYRVLLVPSLYACSDTFGSALARCVEAGAHTVVGPFSGIVDLDDHIRLGGYPGALRDLLGVRVEEFSPLLGGETVDVTADLGGGSPVTTRARVWTESMTCLGAEVAATFVGGVFDGAPAITRRQVGRGAAWYVGTVPADDLLAELLCWVCTDARAARAGGPGLAVTIRESVTCRYVFAINHSDREVPLAASGVDILTGAEWTSGDAVSAGDVVVVRLPR